MRRRKANFRPKIFPTDRFKELTMPDVDLSAEAERLLKDLQQGGLAFNRKEAVEKIAKLSVSNEALVTALIQAREFDDNEAVRIAAAEALQAPAHRTILDNTPGLGQRASVAPKKKVNYSKLGILSYAIAMVSIILVYLDLFIVDPKISGTANPFGLGVGPAVINGAILLAGSFLLPLAGLIMGMIALRSYERKNILGLIGLAGNALILAATAYSVMSR
jgi:hypothetical protein